MVSSKFITNKYNFIKNYVKFSQICTNNIQTFIIQNWSQNSNPQALLSLNQDANMLNQQTQWFLCLQRPKDTVFDSKLS